MPLAKTRTRWERAPRLVPKAKQLVGRVKCFEVDDKHLHFFFIFSNVV